MAQFSDLTPDNNITNDAGETLGVDGKPLYVTEDAQNRVEMLCLMRDMIRELKIIKAHLAVMTGEEFDDGDEGDF